MSYQIVLSCATGVSSTIIAGKMKAAIKVAGLDVSIDVREANGNDLENLKDVDIILLAPTLGHLTEKLTQQYPDTIVKVIETDDYSMMDGDIILEKAFTAIELADEVEKTTFIVIACVEGFSSSLLTAKMKEAAAKIDPTVDIKATAAIPTKVKELTRVDLLLLGPNVAFMKSDFQKLVPKETIIAGIDMNDYGTINGKAIVEKALELLKK